MIFTTIISINDAINVVRALGDGSDLVLPLISIGFNILNGCDITGAYPNAILQLLLQLNDLRLDVQSINAGCLTIINNELVTDILRVQNVSNAELSSAIVHSIDTFMHKVEQLATNL